MQAAGLGLGSIGDGVGDRTVGGGAALRLGSTDSPAAEGGKLGPAEVEQPAMTAAQIGASSARIRSSDAQPDRRVS
jgi:hypothetical protein